MWGKRPGQLSSVFIFVFLWVIFGKALGRDVAFVRKMAWLLLGCVLFVLVGCGSGQEQKSGEKFLIVGTEATFPPFEFQDAKSKEFVGFDIDIIRAVGKELGYTVKIENMPFDALIPALSTDKIDIIASGMTITDERAKKVTFTRSYYSSGLTIVVTKDNDVIRDFADLIGKRIAVQAGTTGAMEVANIKDAQVQAFESANDAYLALKKGSVDAVVNDRPVNEYFLNTGGSSFAKSVGLPRNAEYYGFAVSKKNTQLASRVDKALDVLKKNGEYERIHAKWFGRRG